MSVNANLYALLREGFVARRAETAVEVPDGQALSCREIDDGAACAAAALSAAGATPGARVAVLVEKSPEALMLYLGCLRGGFVCAAIDPALAEPARERAVAEARPAVAVCGTAHEAALQRAGFAHGLAGIYTLDADGTGSLASTQQTVTAQALVAERGPADPAVMLFAATGPGGAVLSHESLADDARALQRTLGLRAGEVVMHLAPLFEPRPLFVALHASLLAGARVLLYPRFDAESIKRHLPRTTVFLGLAEHYLRLLADGGFGREHCAATRLFVCDSDPLPVSTLEEFRARTGHTISQRVPARPVPSGLGSK